jgi:hypothetical protein
VVKDPGIARLSKVFEMAKVGILTAGKQAVEMLGEDGKISVRVEKKALGTAAGDHVVTAGHNLARECHACDVGHGWKKLLKKDPRTGLVENKFNELSSFGVLVVKLHGHGTEKSAW